MQLPAVALWLSAAAPLVAPLGPVHHHVLDNGLVVLLLEDHSSPLVSIGVMYRVGARNEAAGTTGLAHFAEHMNFRATKSFPGSEVTECITRIGGRWNGYTWIDQTYYAETVPVQALDRMLDLEADRMANALYDPEEFGKERTSVIAELHSYDDPHSLLYDAVLATSFEIHPYRNNTIGWLSDVEGVTREEAYRFYRRFYHPNNAVLTVVGDLDPAATLTKIRERFGGLPGAGEPTAVRTLEPPQKGAKRVTLRRPGPHAELLLAYRAPALGDPDFPAMVLCDALVAGGKGFRFTREYAVPPGTPLGGATVGAGLASEARSDWQPSLYPYVYTIAATARGHDLAALEAAVLGSLADAALREWTDDEVSAAVRQVTAAWAEDLDDKAGRAHQLSFFEVSGGHRFLLDLPERVAAVTREGVRRFARERLQPHQATIGWFVPTPEPAGRPRPAPQPTPAPPSVAGEAGAARPTPAMAAPPPAGPAQPATSSSVLGNGLRLLLAPQAGTALVALRGRIDAGSLHDGGTPGLAALAVEVLSRPAPGEDPRSPGLAWTLHDDPAAAVNLRFLEFAASGLPGDLPPVLETLARRLAAAASFSEGDWPALVRAAGERARERAASPETALWQGALARLHPSGSPLSSPPWAGEESFGRLTPQALRGFLTHHVLPSRTTLVVAGAMDPPAARSRIEGTLGRLAQGTGPRREPSPAPPHGVRVWREVESHEPGKAQNEIRVVWPGDRSRPWDRTATDALLYLLGETGYAGRLGRALVEPGLVYSVYATLEEEGAPGFLMVRTAAATRDTPEVLRRIRSILEDMARGRITREELEEARTYLGGKAARSREGAVATAAAVLDGASRPAPVTLTLDQLDDTARRLFRSGAPLALLAGPGTGP